MHFSLIFISRMMELISVNSPEVFFAILIKHYPVRYFKSYPYTEFNDIFRNCFIIQAGYPNK